MWLRAVYLSVLCLTLWTAGCAGPDAGGLGNDAAPAVDDSLGSLTGIVATDALAPIEGAQVFLVESGQNATTQADGTFLLAGIEPGSHRVIFQALGYEPLARLVEIKAGEVTTVSVQLSPLEVTEPYHATAIQDGMIGCGILLKQNNDRNSSHNLLAACGVFGNMGYYNVDRFVLNWPMGSLEKTSGAWGETTWTPTQAAGKGLSALWTVWDSANTAGGAYSFRRINSVSSPMSVSFSSEELMALLASKSTITDCSVGNCTIHTYHYGRAETLGTPVDVGLAMQQRFREYFTLFYNQPLPASFTALPDQ